MLPSIAFRAVRSIKFSDCNRGRTHRLAMAAPIAACHWRLDRQCARIKPIKKRSKPGKGRIRGHSWTIIIFRPGSSPFLTGRRAVSGTREELESVTSRSKACANLFGLARVKWEFATQLGCKRVVDD